MMTINPGTRVRLRRDAKDEFTGRLRRWASEARHGTVKADMGAYLLIQFDVRHAVGLHEIPPATIEVLA